MMIVLLNGCGISIGSLKVDNTCSVRPLEEYTVPIMEDIAQSSLKDATVDWLGSDEVFHKKHNEVIQSEC